MLFAQALRTELSQGDIYGADWDGDLPHPIGACLVLPHDCEIDKPNRDSLLVVRVHHAPQANAGYYGNVTAGRVWSGLPLDGSALPQAWADFRDVRAVPRSVLLDRLDRRVQSMSEEGRLVLASKVFQWLTRTLPPAGP